MNYLIVISFIVVTLLLNACGSSLFLENNEAARANAKLASAYIEHGKYAEAKAKLLLATQQASHEAFVWNAWAYYADATQDSEAVFLYYQRALRLQPRWGILHNNYGVFLCRQGRYSLALEEFKRALSDPNYLHPEQAYRNAALCAARQGNLGLAKGYEAKARAYR